MAALYILLAAIFGMGTIGLLVAAAILNLAWMIVAAIGAGLMTWLFGYMADNTSLF